ncbi:MAG: YncE family protein [Nitrospirota bacterium]
MKKIILLFASLFICTPAYASGPGYHIIKRIQVGGEGGFDYLKVDPGARRLYISRGTHVMVLDIDTDKLAGDIPGTEGVHGVAIAPEFDRGFTSNGRANTSTIFDLKTLKVLGQVKTGENPDCIIYDPASKNVITFNGKSQDATAFDAATGKVAGTIPLGGRPESAEADGNGKIFVNIEDKNEVIELDSMKLSVVNRFSLKPGEEPAGIALDPEHHLVFSGCHNEMMTVLDTVTGKVIATIPIGKGVDANGYDPITGLIFSSNGDGTLTVARELPGGGFGVAETVQTQKGSRTMAIDTKTHNIYLTAARFSPPPPVPAGVKHRPEMVKGSFEVLVVGQ